MNVSDGLTGTTLPSSLVKPRPRFGAWTYRCGFSVVVFGYGIAIGPNRTRGERDEWQRNWTLIKFFRNAAYRGLIRG